MAHALKLWAAATVAMATIAVPTLAHASGGSATAAPRHPATINTCAGPALPGHAICTSLIRTGLPARRGIQPASSAPPGFGPADLQSAYALPSKTAGAGRTVAIVDAYDDPNAAADLSLYRTQYGLPACTTASDCFTKVNQTGQQSNYPPADTGWAGEISLDLDMVSAACPSCRILLVESTTNDMVNLGAAVDEAVKLGAKYISNSYATSGEDPSETSWDQYYNHPGVVLTASAGDSGYQVNFPAVSPYVTSVGGTSLTKDTSTKRGWSETVWSGTGSGCSTIEAKPLWQTDSGCKQRMVADVSADADPNTGVAVYDTYGQSGWLEFGGTSVSSPMIAAIYALAGAPGAGTNPAQYPYDSVMVGAHALNDVTSGSNGVCPTAYWCTGETGYDGPTGLGTPDGTAAFVYRKHGTISGTVTDSGGKPVAGAQVAAASSIAVTDSAGHYSLSLPASGYQVTVTDYGYNSQTSAVTLAAGATVTKNYTLTGTPHETVNGTVMAGTGHAWPLAATVRWSDGTGHSGTVHTAAATGRYSLSLLANIKYTLTVAGSYPGYKPVSRTVNVGTAGVTADVALPVDLLSCTAIGYHPVYSGGTVQGFSGGSLPAGWRVINTDLHYAGYSNAPGWQFTNPGHRVNGTGGAGGFAIVDSDHSGAHHYQDTSLITPVVDLGHATSPELQFSTDLVPAVNSSATVQVSVDGGSSWVSVWHRTGLSGAVGEFVVALPRAAGKAHVLARFGYVGSWSRYWEIDNAFLGQRTCQQQAGSLIVGQVTDATTGSPLSGAVISGGGTHATTTASGMYWLFSTASGSARITATMAGHTAATKIATLTTGQVTPVNFTLSS